MLEKLGFILVGAGILGLVGYSMRGFFMTPDIPVGLRILAGIAIVGIVVLLVYVSWDRYQAYRKESKEIKEVKR